MYLLNLLAEDVNANLDMTWMLIGALLVFFMQAGFAMVETGFTRAKNAGNIIMKNLLDFAIGTIVYWALGFSLMFGTDVLGVVGTGDLFTKSGNYGFLIFQTVFAATAATIVSGAMAERTKFSAYCIYSFVISLVIYPISGHWIWGGGWLSNLGFKDFAGSTVVHMVGGIAALVGAKILGPRIGKYSKDGKSHAILGHSITLGALGVFILWFGWFGFNGASTLSMTGDNAELAAKIFVTTNLSAATATLATLITTWIRYKKPDVSMTLNGSLAGLVAITAGCAFVDPWAAAVIGVIAGIVIVFSVEFFDKVLKIDDPVGAISVHGVCGLLGTLLVGVFDSEAGIITGNFSLLGVQALGVASVVAWVVVTMLIVFFAIKFTIGLRVSREEEIQGLDIHEHGLPSAYADFALAVETIPTEEGIVMGSVPEAEALPIQVVPSKEKPASDVKLTKVEIICRQRMFDTLKDAMSKIGITGMTVTNVLGCGMQKGSAEVYRGVPVEINLLPKVQVEMVVAKVPVKTVVDTARKVLYTGHIGDGKIFVYDVENVIKIRTGEQGYDALQDSEA